MAELTFKSPGVSTREIDLSGPRRTGPTGVPAGVIGTSQKGRAFVPLVFANFADFVAEFGGVSADQFGPLALREWFQNANAGLYLKVLGVGDGKARLDAAGASSRGEPLPAGSVVNAGFVVGQDQVDPSTGRISDNPFANAPHAAAKAVATIDFAGVPNVDQTVVITDAAGLSKTYTAKAAEALAGREFDQSGTAAQTATSLAACINTDDSGGAGGHGATITALASDTKLTLTQDVAGKSGNTLVTSALANTTVTNFLGGLDFSGPKGRTYFLGCTMKETAEVAATAKISYTANPSAGKTIKLVSSDRTEKLYVMGAAGDTRQGGGAMANADVLAEGDQVGGVALAAGDARIGGIHVEIGGNADATYANLKAAINTTAHHGLRITITHAVEGNANTGDFTMTQLAKGREGNTVITSDLDADKTTVPAAFAGGKGFRIFSEAAAGKAGASGIKYAPVLRGVLMVPSGVVPALSASRAEVFNNTPVGQPGLSGVAARASILFTGVPDTGATFVIKNAAGNPITFTATDNETGSEVVPNFRAGADAAGAAANLKAAILHADGQNGTVSASTSLNDNSAAKITLIQATPGVAGNQVIATTGNTNATVVSFSGGLPAAALSAASAVGFGPAKGYDNGGSEIGSVNTFAARQEFTMLLNGHKSTSSHPSVLTASFDPMSSNYFAKLLNTDPEAIQEAGHYLYTHYDVFPAYALPDASADSGLLEATYTGRDRGSSGDSSLISNVQDKSDIAFMFPMTGNRNEGTTTRANAENFSDRFRTAVSPTVISQKFGGENKDLFKVHSLDDGANGGLVFKITIENIKPSRSEKDRYGTFDLNVRGFSDNDREPLVVESFKAVNLNPISERFLARVVGDQRIFYDFDKSAGSQKLVVSGKFPNNSRNIRVEVDSTVDKGEMDPTALPVGFRGIPKLNIDNANSFSNPAGSSIADASLDGTNAAIITPPLGLRRTLGLGQTPKMRVAANLCWGVQFEADDQSSEPNKNTRVVSHMPSLTKYFPDFDQANLSLLERDSAAADSYNNNKFTLENIQVLTNAAGQPDSKEWPMALYRRDGVLDVAIKDVDGNDASGKTRFLNTTSDFQLGSVRKFLKFTFFAQGGFDGVEIFDSEKASLSDVAVMREVSDSSAQGGKNGPTAATYAKSVDVLAEKSDVDIQLLAIPGIRQPIVTDRAIEAVEDRFDAMLIMDAVPYDFDGLPITSVSQKVSVSQTVSNFSNRILDSSFAAAYFPDVVLNDSQTGQNIAVPPSVPVLGAFALNDRLAHPWFAPAGFTRGAMDNVIETKVKLNRDNLDSLYEADINPLTSFPHSEGVIVFGQKTLLRTQSSLDRVNVRRLLIEIRRRVRSIANNFIFEPNRESTLARFSSQVNPVLRQIQQQQGVDRFLVKIDTTTTTQTDVENNTLRGKIFLQPTRSVEFVSLDFVITNAGAEI